jgi:cytidylate kinase
MSGRRWTIAVDGPAGAGKSTAARLVAAALGYLYIDTGAMYRALALKALESGVDLRDEEEVARVLANSRITLGGPEDGGGVWLDGHDVTRAVRTPEVNASVSVVAGFPKVRAYLVERQREMARGGGVVLDGRDIGTYVLPHADFKFYLTASLAARAERRRRELEAMGFQASLEELQSQIAHRDHLDASRALAPLRQAPDACVLDTTDMAVEDVVRAMLEIVRARRD